MPMKLLFLPDKGYFFNTGRNCYWKGLDRTIENVFSRTPKFQELLHLAIGSKSFFIFIRDGNGQLQILPGHELDAKHPDLAQWMNRHTSAPSLIALGPNGEFWAPSTLEYMEADRYENVPSQFLKDLEKMKNIAGGWKDGLEPYGVIFGIQQSYLITCKRGECLLYSSNFKDHYPNLCQQLEERFRNRGSNKCVYTFITINPYTRDEWVAIWADGSFSWSLSPAYSMLLGHIEEWIGNRFSSSGLSAGPPTLTHSVSTPLPNYTTPISPPQPYTSLPPPNVYRSHSTPTYIYTSHSQTTQVVPANTGTYIRPSYTTPTYTSPAAVIYTPAAGPPPPAATWPAAPAATSTGTPYNAPAGQTSNIWTTQGEQILKATEKLINGYTDSINNNSNASSFATAGGGGNGGGWFVPAGGTTPIYINPTGGTTAATASPMYVDPTGGTTAAPVYFDPTGGTTTTTTAAPMYVDPTGGTTTAAPIYFDPTGGTATAAAPTYVDPTSSSLDQINQMNDAVNSLSSIMGGGVDPTGGVATGMMLGGGGTGMDWGGFGC